MYGALLRARLLALAEPVERCHAEAEAAEALRAAVEEQLRQEVVHRAVRGVSAVSHQVDGRLARRVGLDSVDEGDGAAPGVEQHEDGSRPHVTLLEHPQRELALAAARQAEPTVGHFPQLPQNAVGDGRLVLEDPVAFLIELAYAAAEP